MRFYYVYMLECSDGSYYTGFTNNYERRLYEHNAGTNPKAYTFNRRPVKLVYLTEFTEPIKGIEFEKQLKGWSRKKKIALINGDMNKLKQLAECKNETHFKNYNKKKL